MTLCVYRKRQVSEKAGGLTAGTQECAHTHVVDGTVSEAYRVVKMV